MQKLLPYEIFKTLQNQKRIVSAETIRGNTVLRYQAATIIRGQFAYKAYWLVYFIHIKN